MGPYRTLGVPTTEPDVKEKPSEPEAPRDIPQPPSDRSVPMISRRGDPWSGRRK